MLFERGHFKSDKLQKSFISESLNESRQFSTRTAYTYKPTVFLSHKHNDLEDEEELKGFIEVLQDFGVKVYIDSMDNTLPAQTSGDTAKRIKEIIKFCDKFILLATEKAIESYWCNWELGIGDVHKYIKNIAFLPIKEKGTYDWNYKGNEYLHIYPKIQHYEGFRNLEGHYFQTGYYVCLPENKDGRVIITLLKDWLKEN